MNQVRGIYRNEAIQEERYDPQYLHPHQHKDLLTSPKRMGATTAPSTNQNHTGNTKKNTPKGMQVMLEDDAEYDENKEIAKITHLLKHLRTIVSKPQFEQLMKIATNAIQKHIDLLVFTQWLQHLGTQKIKNIDTYLAVLTITVDNEERVFRGASGTSATRTVSSIGGVDHTDRDSEETAGVTAVVAIGDDTWKSNAETGFARHPPNIGHGRKTTEYNRSCKPMTRKRIFYDDDDYYYPAASSSSSSPLFQNRTKQSTTIIGTNTNIITHTNDFVRGDNGGMKRRYNFYDWYAMEEQKASHRAVSNKNNGPVDRESNFYDLCSSDEEEVADNTVQSTTTKNSHDNNDRSPYYESTVITRHDMIYNVSPLSSSLSSPSRIIKTNRHLISVPTISNGTTTTVPTTTAITSPSRTDRGDDDCTVGCKNDDSTSSDDDNSSNKDDELYVII